MDKRFTSLQYTLSRVEIKEKFLSCCKNRSLSAGFNIFWAVLLYCKLYNTEIKYCRIFLHEFSTKALHMGYAATYGEPTLHQACFCKQCQIRTECLEVLLERGHFKGPDGKFPPSVDSIDKWCPDDQVPLPYFKMYYDLCM